MNLDQVLPLSQAEEMGFSADRLARINTVMQEYIDKRDGAGIVWLVACHGKVIRFETQGMMNVEKKVPMTKNTIFWLASLRKPLVAVSVLKLIEEGHLKLDDPISKFIPEFKNPVVASIQRPGQLEPAREITVRDLLTFTSGIAAPGRTPISLTNQFYAAFGGEETAKPVAEIIKALANVPLNFHPGTSWQYQEDCAVLTVLVEIISGKTMNQFLRDSICEPLGMRDTYCFGVMPIQFPQDKLSQLATFYVYDERGKISADNFPADNFHPGIMHGNEPKFIFNANNGRPRFYSTVYDYARFLQMLLNGGELEGVRFLGRKTVELMTTNHIGNLPVLNRPGWGYGLGVGVRTSIGGTSEIGSVGAYTWGGGQWNTMVVDPKEDMLCIMMSAVAHRDNTLQREFSRLVYQALT